MSRDGISLATTLTPSEQVRARLEAAAERLDQAETAVDWLFWRLPCAERVQGPLVLVASDGRVLPPTPLAESPAARRLIVEFATTSQYVVSTVGAGAPALDDIVAAGVELEPEHVAALAALYCTQHGREVLADALEDELAVELEEVEDAVLAAHQWIGRADEAMIERQQRELQRLVQSNRDTRDYLLTVEFEGARLRRKNMLDRAMLTAQVVQLDQAEQLRVAEESLRIAQDEELAVLREQREVRIRAARAATAGRIRQAAREPGVKELAIVAAYPAVRKSGSTASILATRCGCTDVYVRKVLKKHGLPLK